MFEALSDRFQGIFRQLSGQVRLTPDNIRDSLREVRRALLEADVPVAVAKEFVARIEARAVGEETLKGLHPGQQVIGVVREELEKLLGSRPPTLAGSPFIPTIVLLAGLQGSGKTTFAGKLAKWLKAKEKRVLLASADIYRPAAIDQLERVAAQAGATFWRAADGTLAWGDLKQHGADQGFTLTTEEMGAFIKSADLGGQWVSRQNVKNAACWASTEADLGKCGNGGGGEYVK